MHNHNCHSSLRITLFFLLLLIPVSLWSIDVKVALKNGNEICGQVKEETAEYIVVDNEIGQIKIWKNQIRQLVYSDTPSISSTGEQSPDAMDMLNDLVIVHLNNESVINGQLIAKSLGSILIRTELGRLSIAKSDVRLIEYINSQFAERGEKVLVQLVSGATIQGFLHHEDRGSLTVDSEMGRLTIPKPNLRSIQYFEMEDRQREFLPETKQSFSRPSETGGEIKAPSTQRQDILALGYSTRFGNDYGLGGVFAYQSRFHVKTFSSFSLYTECFLDLAIFSLKKDAVLDQAIPGSINATGTAIVSSFGVGAPFHFYSSDGSPYEFFIQPNLEMNLVYTSLKKEYPSYPSLNSELRSSDFLFGFGLNAGIDYTLKPELRLGLCYTMHFILGETDYSGLCLRLTTKFF